MTASDLIQPKVPYTQKPERILILGWNWRGDKIIRELDHYLVEGSEIVVIANGGSVKKEVKHLKKELGNLKISFNEGDITDRKTLDELEITKYKHIIILCYSDTLSPQRADAHTLVTLLHLRDIAEKTGKSFSHGQRNDRYPQPQSGRRDPCR